MYIYIYIYIFIFDWNLIGKEGFVFNIVWMCLIEVKPKCYSFALGIIKQIELWEFLNSGLILRDHCKTDT